MTASSASPRPSPLGAAPGTPLGPRPPILYPDTPMTKPLDYKGLKCPMPIVRLSLEARTLARDESLTIEADDPAFRADLPAWARRTGFTIVDFVADGRVQRATVRRS